MLLLKVDLYFAKLILNKLPVKKHGFTLIELLVVISIIAILSAIGFVTYQSILKEGSDAKRQSDLRTIQSALEQYRADVGNYPLSLPNVGSPITSPDGSKTYLNQLPQDPRGGGYFYTSSGGSCTAQQKYYICALLENPGSLANRCCLPGDSCSPIEDKSAPPKYYCVGPP